MQCDYKCGNDLIIDTIVNISKLTPFYMKKIKFEKIQINDLI